jgi:hypothetical protein
LLLRPCGAFLPRPRERLEAVLLLQPGDTLGARLEVEAQRPVDGDLAEAEVRGREEAADDDVFRLAVVTTLRVSPSRKSARIFRTSCARSSGISRRLSPRLFRIGVQKEVASMSWTVPLRAGALRFVTTHT